MKRGIQLIVTIGVDRGGSGIEITINRRNPTNFDFYRQADASLPLSKEAFNQYVLQVFERTPLNFTFFYFYLQISESNNANRL